MQDDAADAQWHSVAEVPQPLAFDHKLIIRTAFEHLLQRPEVTSSGTQLPARIFCSCTQNDAILRNKPVDEVTCGCMLVQEFVICMYCAGELVQQLQQGAKKLEGPWQPPKE